MRSRKNKIQSALLLMLMAACTNNVAAQATLPSLKDIFKNDFSIGTALNTTEIEEKDPQAAALIVQQFNTATPENVMKAEIIHPMWDTYNFSLADKMVAYCKKNNIRVNAHTLIWHSQLPAF